MKEGIMFCIGIILYGLECACWYICGIDDGESLDLIRFLALLLMRLFSTLFIVLPLLREYGVI